MPLLKGCSKKTLYNNYRKERNAGRDADQAWAIAYDYARKQGCKGLKSKRKKGKS